MSYSPYVSVSVASYNPSPPADDGSTGATNRITWSGIKTKLADPLNTAIAALDTNIAAAFALRSFRAKSAQAGDYTTVLADNGKIIAASGSPTITLLAAATAGEGYQITIVNVGAGLVLLDGTSAETINGFNVVELSNKGDSAVLMCDGSNYVGTVTRSVGRVATFIYSAAGATAPNGTLKCDGSTIGSAASVATYKGEKYRTLFDIIKGGGWGNVGSESFDGNSTVALPSSVDRIAIGGSSTYTLGGTGGAATVTSTGTVGGTAVSQANLPNVTLGPATTDDPGTHTHTYTSPNNDHNTSVSGGQATSGGGSGASTGTGGAHTHAVSTSLGGSGTTHTHSFTGNAISSINPYYAPLVCIVY